MSEKRIVALVPMKGHSERVPNKNMKMFAGKPLCQWILETLLNVSRISNIYVNTDSKKIAEFVETISSKIIAVERPEYLHGDDVSMNKILEYDISNIDADIFLQTHSTNPLVESKTIDKAIETYINALRQNNYDSLFGVTKMQTRFYTEAGTPVNHNPEELIPTQKLPPLFEENSNIYLFTPKSFLSGGKRIGEKALMFEISKIESIDIDYLEEFQLAELVKLNSLGTLRATKVD